MVMYRCSTGFGVSDFLEDVYKYFVSLPAFGDLVLDKLPSNCREVNRGLRSSSLPNCQLKKGLRLFPTDFLLLFPKSHPQYLGNFSLLSGRDCVCSLQEPASRQLIFGVHKPLIFALLHTFFPGKF